jgi:hypothetical protein
MEGFFAKEPLIGQSGLSPRPILRSRIAGDVDRFLSLGISLEYQ